MQTPSRSEKQRNSGNSVSFNPNNEKNDLKSRPAQLVSKNPPALNTQFVTPRFPGEVVDKGLMRVKKNSDQEPTADMVGTNASVHRKGSFNSSVDCSVESARLYFSARRCRPRISHPKQLANSSWDSDDFRRYDFPRNGSPNKSDFDDDDDSEDENSASSIGTFEEHKGYETGSGARRHNHVAGFPGLSYVKESRIVFWTQNEARTIIRDKGVDAAHQWAENAMSVPSK